MAASSQGALRKSLALHTPTPPPSARRESTKSYVGTGSHLAGPVFPAAGYGAIALAVFCVWSLWLLNRAARRPLTPQYRDGFFILGSNAALFLGLIMLAFCPGLSVFGWIAVELIALGLYSVGLVVGFLFGVPEYVKGGGTNSAPGSALTSGRQILQPNSNISKVSDWLTTAITAVTLSQIVLVPHYIARFGTVLESALQLPHYGTALAAGLALYFPAIGFLSGYMITTIFLIRSLNEAVSSLFSADVQQVLANAAPSDLMLAGTQAQPSAAAPAAGSQAISARIGDVVSALTKSFQPQTAVGQAIESVTSVSLADLNTAEDKAAWARAQALAGNYKEAVLGFQQAIALRPNDANLLQNYASALYNAGGDAQAVIDAYNRALPLLGADAAARARVLANIGLAYLYIPGGYSRALENLNQVLNDPAAPKDAAYYFYRACANGQRWAALPEDQQEDRNSTGQSIIDDTRAALRLSPDLKREFQIVADPNCTGKDPDETDLEAFASANPEYRKLIGLDGQPGE